MDLKNMLAGGAIGGVMLGLITTCWARATSITWWLLSWMVLRVSIRDDQTSEVVLSYMIANLKRTKVYERLYSGKMESIKSDGKFGMIPFEMFAGKPILFWVGWRPILYSPNGGGTSSKPDNSGSSYGQRAIGNGVTLICLNRTIDPEAIIMKACADRNAIAWTVAKGSDARRRFFIRNIPESERTNNNGNGNSGGGNGMAWYHEGIYRLLSHSPNDLGRAHSGTGAAMSYLIFPERITRLIQEIHIWRSNREWYQKRGIPWKRGWILYGPPGTGKTALARAFAEDEDMPLFIFSLRDMTNSDMTKTWAELEAHVPCIALFEDFDNVFHGRENVSGRSSRRSKMAEAVRKAEKSDDIGEDDDPDMMYGGRFGGVSFDCLLNCLDGAQKVEGIFTIITTNDISKIDEAIGCPRPSVNGETEFISSRPGRIDKAIELSYMEYGDKIDMANRILYEFPLVLAEIIAWLDKNRELKETPAQFQERCSQRALAEFWVQQQKKIVVPEDAEEVAA